MRVATRAKQIFELAKKPSIFTCQSRYLFVISHMRSRSSLLSHIFGSHPQISGYVEQHNAYAGWPNLMKLRADIYLDTKDSLQNQYLLDKILHNPLDVSENILTLGNVKVIFLLREPDRTFQSIIRNCHETGVPDWKEPEQVLHYYSQRLERLMDYSAVIGKKALFVESDQLVDDTDSVLAQISDWLGLSTPLDQNYTVFNKTGILGYGDPLGNIKSGKIVKTQKPTGIEIPSALLTQGQQSYDDCRRVLSNNCSGV